MARAMAFNKHTVKEFFNNLGVLMDKHKFTVDAIYNTEETGMTVVQTPQRVLAEKGKKRVGSITWAERVQCAQFNNILLVLLFHVPSNLQTCSMFIIKLTVIAFGKFTNNDSTCLTLLN